MLKILSKILVMVLISILLLNISMNTIYAAIEVELNKAYLEKIGQADYHLKYYREKTGKYTYIVCSIVGYYDKNKNFNPTYCMNKDLVGAETDPYYVTTQSLLKNDKVWRIIKNGYPYKTAKELGLDDKYDAYAVTKFAIYCILGESDINMFKAESDDEEAVKMLKVLKNLVNIGNNGTEKQNENPLKISKVGELTEVKNEENTTYSQEYSVTSTADFSSYKIESINGLPENAYVSTVDGKQQTEFKNGENFKIIIPEEDMLEDFDIKINISSECKAYIILEGKTTVTNTQNYVVTAGEYATATAETELKYQVGKGKIKIIKVDSDDKNIKLQGVKFDVLDENSNLLETIVTDENGEAITSEYKLRQYKKLYFKEIETNENYVLNGDIVEVELKEGETRELQIENEKIKGKIQITKTSKDDNKITGKKAGSPLKDVEFEVYDEKNNLVEKIATNKNGIAITSDLVKGKYTVKEIKTNEYYFLNTDKLEAEIKENGEVVKLEVQNESKTPNVDVEKTGTERAEVGTEIEYDISARNTGNTELKEFVLEDIIPYEYINVSKISTGTFNQNLKYDFYYKTNFSDGYILMMEDLNSQENYEISFSKELADNEYVTGIKMEFDKVEAGFCSNENPHIKAIIKQNVKSEETFTNTVTLSGKLNEYGVTDVSKWKTTAYKLLPITGM